MPAARPKVPSRPGEAWVGLLVGFFLAMPLFEIFLLTVLAIDGGWFDASYTARYFSNSVTLVSLLALWHVVAALLGMAVRLFWLQVGRRRRLRAVSGGAGQ